MKRHLALLLAVLLVAANLTATAAAENAIDHVSSIEEQFKAFAQPLLGPDSKETNKAALKQMMDRALSKDAAGDLIMGQNDPMTAIVMNSALYSETIAEGLANAIDYMRMWKRETLYIRGGAGWYDHGYSHTLRVYADNLNENDEDDRPYGSVLGISKFLGKTNEFDDTLMLIAGSTRSRATLELLETTETAQRFRVKFYLFDDFDFNGDYSNIAGNTELAEFLTSLGQFMNLNEFFWSVSAEMELTVPFFCDHKAANYHWEHNGEQMFSITEDGFAENAAEKVLFVSDEKTYAYYQLDKTVHLFHDKPWTVEFTCAGNSTLVLSPAPNINSALPFLARTMSLQPDGTYDKYIFAGEQVFRQVTKEEQELLGITQSMIGYRDYHGVDYTDVYESSEQHYRLDNRVAEDGSNMIWVTVDGQEVGPMVNWYQSYGDSGLTALDDPTDWVIGQDFVINCIGNKNWPIGEVIRSVSVWENGKDSASPNCGSGVVTEPTCTAGGYTTYTCSICDRVYISDETAASGHDYTDVRFLWNGDLTAMVTTGACGACGGDGVELDCTVTAEPDDPGCLNVKASASDGGGWSRSQIRQITLLRTDKGISVNTSLALTDLAVWAAAYGPGGRLLTIQPVAADGSAPVSGADVRVFFLDPRTHMPILPNLVLP